MGPGEVGRFDQRNTIFSKIRDPERFAIEILEMGVKRKVSDSREMTQNIKKRPVIWGLGGPDLRTGSPLDLPVSF